MLQKISIDYSFPVIFTENLFKEENLTLREVVAASKQLPAKVLLVVDKGITDKKPDLSEQVKKYFRIHKDVLLLTELIEIEGGESCKNSFYHVEQILKAADRNGICRQSYIAAIGGGSVLDMVGFAATICHRGIRHIRIPSTVLSQNDSGVGVKNGINFFGKKNFLGTFNPPIAVLNDFNLLNTLSDRDWKSGISEAVKVALIKDETFFFNLERFTDGLNKRDSEPMKKLIVRCAELHMQHIAFGGDPFETGSSRPLDFGHWAAHKLEQLTRFDLRHGEAVAIGIGLDATYSYLKGFLSQSDHSRIIRLLKALRFKLHVREMEEYQEELISGLNEFREHLGGKLTIMLLEKIGVGKEVNEMDMDIIRSSLQYLKEVEGEETIKISKS